MLLGVNDQEHNFGQSRKMCVMLDVYSPCWSLSTLPCLSISFCHSACGCCVVYGSAATATGSAADDRDTTSPWQVPWLSRLHGLSID